MRQVQIEKIIEVVNKTENVKIDLNQIDENLVDKGMDSITFIQIIVGLEEMFDCEIPDSKLLISEMDSVKKIFDVLENLHIANS
ncbi:MAG: hypothetical protein DBY04_03500 [Clostridiales bacterium]|nr:MAG: hypothetical protein DBY04_03500 [Clostridiales bacterium]